MIGKEDDRVGVSARGGHGCLGETAVINAARGVVAPPRLACFQMQVFRVSGHQDFDSLIASGRIVMVSIHIYDDKVCE